jgi:hypothetical protein
MDHTLWPLPVPHLHALHASASPAAHPFWSLPAECTSGWGVQYNNLAAISYLAVRPRPGTFSCVECSQQATPGVPLLYSSNVTLTYTNATQTWSLVLGTPKSKALWNSVWLLSKKRGVPPPLYYRGQCVPCPLGSAANALNTQCGESQTAFVGAPGCKACCHCICGYSSKA